MQYYVHHHLTLFTVQSVLWFFFELREWGHRSVTKSMLLILGLGLLKDNNFQKPEMTIQRLSLDHNYILHEIMCKRQGKCPECFKQYVIQM